MIVIIYRVYQLEENDSESLQLLCLGITRKVKCYNEYFINKYIFHTKKYDQGRKTCNSRICVKETTSNEFEVDYYEKLEEVIEWNIIASLIKFSYSNAICMIPLIKES